MLIEYNLTEVISLAKSIRLNALKMINSGKSSHIGSVLSIADILAVLYGAVLNFKSDDPNWSLRDRFVLSKGHAGAGVYAVLAEKGFFPKEVLKKYYKNGSFLSGHVSHKEVPGVEFSTGSLGHGLGVASGMAYAAILNDEDHRIFVVMSDGECDEGSNWEAILFAAHHNLHNLNVIVDYNKLQSIKSTEETLGLEPFVDKWKAFGWNVVESNGHDHLELINALNHNNKIKKPLCIIAHTIKGKGVSFMENNTLWHYRSPQGEEFNSAFREISDA